MHGLTRAGLRFAAVGVLAAISAAGLGAAPATAATGEVMVAGAELGQGLYFDWQTDGTSGWNEEPVASGSFDPPAVTVQSDGNVLISAVDTGNGALYFFWQQYGTSTWNAEQVTGTGTMPQGYTSIASQTIMSPGQPAVVAIVGSNDVLYTQQIGQSGWVSQDLPGGYGGQARPYVDVAPNNTIQVIFAPGADDGTAGAEGFYLDRQTYLSGSWSTLHVQTGTMITDPEIAQQAGGNLIVSYVDVDTAGTSGGVDFAWSPANDLDSWYGQTVSASAGATDSQGVSMADDPGASLIALAAVQGDCADAYVQPYGAGGWSTEKLACWSGAPASTNPTIAAESNGALVAAYGGPTGQGYFSWRDSADTWHQESLPGMSDVAPNSITVTSYTP